MKSLKTLLLATSLLVFPITAQAGDLLRIGAAGPITGKQAVFGEQMKAGIDMAVQDINAAGGILGKKLEAVISDDACDPKQAVAAANDLVSKKVGVVFGHFCSGSTIPASNVYNEEGVLMISPGSSNPLITDRGLWNIFRVCGRDDQQGKSIANFIGSHFQGKKIVIAHDKQTYSKGLAEEVKKNLNAAGITEVLFDTVTPGERDYSAFVTKLKQINADLLVYGGYHTEAGLIVRQMRDHGLKTVLIAGDALATEEYGTITGAAGNGTLMSFGPNPARDPNNAAIVEHFTKAGLKPEGYALYTYAAVQTYAAAVKAAGSLDAKKVAEKLKSEKFSTVLGQLSFDSKGDVTIPTFAIYEWQNGKYDYYPEKK
ncbi:MAG: branched-chain amino acid ABC transporter substrate-binding protein [Alphaproteobacteria bacterium]